MSLRHIKEKIKPLLAILRKTVNSVIIYLIVVISIINAFGIGYLSGIPSSINVYTEKNFAIDFINPKQGSAAHNSGTATATGDIVASKNGTKYYKTTCSGAKRIKEENKVYFQTVDDAVMAGYGEAKGCF